MQSIQRRMGKMLPRTADESQVAVLLKDFEDIDRALDGLIAASKTWRDSWKMILRKQQLTAAEFDLMFQPIIGGQDYNGPPMGETPEHIANRSMKLAAEYAELETDMNQEINEMDLRVIRPAEEAKVSIQPLKKTIKKRQDRKLDFERYQGRYDNSMKKIGRSDRENTALKKHEADLAAAREEYQTADTRMREVLPPILQAVFSLLPYILAAQIIIQNNLLGHCYTQISEFCSEWGLPNPAPDFPVIIEAWEHDFADAKAQIESLNIVRKGKTVGLPMRQAEKKPSSTNLRRPSNQSTRTPSFRSEVSPARSDVSSVTAQSIPPSPNVSTKPNVNMSTKPKSLSASEYDQGRPRMLSVPSQGSLALSQPNYALSSDTPQGASPAGPKADYFSRDRFQSPGSSNGTTPSALATAAAAKKKPPPPPKPKRINSMPAIFVTAIYDFAGQGQGDLDFKEGDRIKVLKRTNSTQDWWEGELRGIKGAFPANYVQTV